MGKAPPGTSKDEWQPERIMVIISDIEWDLNGLKDSNGKPAEKEKIISRVRESYDRIYTAMGSETFDGSMSLPSTGLNQFAKPTPKSFLFNSGRNSHITNAPKNLFKKRLTNPSKI